MIEEKKRLIAEMCAKGHAVNAPSRNGYTTTNNFNHYFSRKRKERAYIYSILGSPDAAPITAESCEEVDCLHKCYGEDQMGFCEKCMNYYVKEKKRHDTICDMCVV